MISSVYLASDILCAKDL